MGCVRFMPKERVPLDLDGFILAMSKRENARFLRLIARG